MHKLVKFVQLVLYWYNGFSHSVVMESDLLLRSVWENRDTCHNVVRRQIASTLKKVIAHLWILVVVSQQDAFFTDA